MAENPDLIGTGALSIAVVCLARGLEFVLTKWRQPQAPDAPPPRSLEARVAALESVVMVLQQAEAAHRERTTQILDWLRRLEAKLDQLLMR
jgi:hypothetical protein